MTHTQKEKYEALSEAMEIILLGTTVSPGTQAYRIIQEDVKRLIDQKGSVEALNEIKQTQKQHQAEAAYLESMM